MTRAEKCLDIIRSEIAATGKCPTRRIIIERMGLLDPRALDDVLLNLIVAGKLERERCRTSHGSRFIYRLKEPSVEGAR